MNLTFCNVTAEDGDVEAEEPLSFGMTFHHFGLLLCIIFMSIACALSLWLMFMHATHYSAPLEQRYIIRIVFMVPIYAVISMLSFAFWRHSVYFEVIRDCYEAFAIASFFALMCHYVAPDLHEQKNYFRTIQPLPWIWPLKWGKWSIFKTPRSGLTWFNIVWFGVFQYCVVRVVCTIIAVVTQYFDVYCLSSDSPAFAHVWVTVIEAIGVTVAMICLIQFYFQLKEKLSAYSPFAKLLAIKLVIFLCFWQTFILSFLTSQNRQVIHAGIHVSQPDLSVGIPALCVCGEMAIFAVMHVFVYPWRPYQRSSAISMQLENQTGAKRDKYYGGPLGVLAYLDAFNPLDIFKAVGRGFRWVFVGRRKREQDVSYQKYHETATGAGPLGQSTTLGPLSNLTKTGKYQKLGDDDDQDIPLTSHAASVGATGQPSYGHPQGPHQQTEYPMSNFSNQGSNPFGDPSTGQSDSEASRIPTPYEKYRTQRQSRHQAAQSQSSDLGTMPAPAHEEFEPVPTAGPTPVPMNPSQGRPPYPVDPSHELMIPQDTGYHGADHSNPWGSNRL